MPLQTITLDGVAYVRQDSLPPAPKPEEMAVENGQSFCIVRCGKAGVHAGYVIHHDQTAITLRNSRRLWRWWSKFTLSGLATEGTLQSKLSEQRFGAVIPHLIIPWHDVAEVIPVTVLARDRILAVPEWRNQ